MKENLLDKKIIEDIISSIHLIYEWTKNVDSEDFKKDLILTDAVSFRIYRIIQLSEKVSENLLEKTENTVINDLKSLNKIIGVDSFNREFIVDLVYNRVLALYMCFLLELQREFCFASINLASLRLLKKINYQMSFNYKMSKIEKN